MANTSWAFASIPYDHRPLRAAISAQAIARITQFNSQSLSNTVWAFATLNYLNTPF
eukprot:CAMPEP_0180822626 /NCGR_PEP_ID=MMETSP1038_2-20121128/71462_1 /TAXON_ID=632150 /ORGANISM="Azadinium spinosum, Strain 3D9" /LENGTH=55 /DNA_ID=CAMNT_0022864883 /DNA_START=26 /DNA_END=190 /DNA_ORIENTATION=-